MVSSIKSEYIVQRDDKLYTDVSTLIMECRYAYVVGNSRLIMAAASENHSVCGEKKNIALNLAVTFSPRY